MWNANIVIWQIGLILKLACNDRNPEETHLTCILSSVSNLNLSKQLIWQIQGLKLRRDLFPSRVWVPHIVFIKILITLSI